MKAFRGCAIAIILSALCWTAIILIIAATVTAVRSLL